LIKHLNIRTSHQLNESRQYPVLQCTWKGYI